MLLVRGHGGGTALTGTVYERGEDPPTYAGAPDSDAPYVWVCDEFYEVASGGALAEIGGRELRVAFETPVPRGFDTREAAVEAARDHLRTQFSRVGVPAEEVRIETERVDHSSQRTSS